MVKPEAREAKEAFREKVLTEEKEVMAAMAAIVAIVGVPIIPIHQVKAVRAAQVVTEGPVEKVF